MNRALAFNEAVKNEPKYSHLGKWLDNDNFEIQINKASEPSDIIWENRHFTNRDRFKKKICVAIVLTLLLLTTFCIIFPFASYSLRTLRMYPDVSCANLQGYGD